MNHFNKFHFMYDDITQNIKEINENIIRIRDCENDKEVIEICNRIIKYRLRQIRDESTRLIDIRSS